MGNLIGTAASGIGLGVEAATLGIAAKAVEGIGKSGHRARKKHKRKARATG